MVEHQLVKTKNIHFSLHLAKVQHYYSNTNAFLVPFSGKVYCKVVLKYENLQSHMISYQSLLLSTTVFNDIGGKFFNETNFQNF